MLSPPGGVGDLAFFVTLSQLKKVLLRLIVCKKCHNLTQCVEVSRLSRLARSFLSPPRIAILKSLDLHMNDT